MGISSLITTGIVVTCALAGSVYGQSSQFQIPATVPSASVVQNALNNSAILIPGSSVPHMLTDKLANQVNVKDFGAQCNGNYDDTAAFQAAISSATYGLSIDVPPGVCVISSSINITRDNIKFRGAGQGATYLKAVNVTKLFNVFNPNGTQIVLPEFSDFSVDLSSSPNGTAFYFSAARSVNITRVYISNAYRGFWFDHTAAGVGSNTVHLSEFYVENTADVNGARGILLDGIDDDWFISNGRLFQGSSSHNNIGLEIRSGGGFMINNVDISDYGNALVIDPPAGYFVRYAQIHGLQCDTTWGDAAILDGSAAFASGYPNGVYNLHFVNSWFSSAGVTGGNGNGLNVVSAEGVVVDTSQFYSNSLNGVRIQAAARDITISNSVFSGNSNGYGNGGATQGLHNGIEADPGASYFGILNNRSGRSSVYSNTQLHGIHIGSGANHYRVIGNDVANNLGTTYQDDAQSPSSAVGLNLLN